MLKKLLLVILSLCLLGASEYDSDKTVVQCIRKTYELKNGFNTYETLTAYECRFPDLNKTCLIIKGLGMYCWGGN